MRVLRAIGDFVIGDDLVTALVVLVIVAVAALAARAGMLDEEVLLVTLAVVVIAAVGLRVVYEAARARHAP